MPYYPLTNFEIQECYQSESKIHKIITKKDGAYVVNIYAYK